MATAISRSKRRAWPRRNSSCTELQKVLPGKTVGASLHGPESHRWTALSRRHPAGRMRRIPGGRACGRGAGGAGARGVRGLRAGRSRGRSPSNAHAERDRGPIRVTARRGSSGSISARRKWTLLFVAEVLDLQTYAGGLTPVRQVGSMQSLGLALKGKDGRSYTFRTFDKKPTHPSSGMEALVSGDTVPGPDHGEPSRQRLPGAAAG